MFPVGFIMSKVQVNDYVVLAITVTGQRVVEWFREEALHCRVLL